MTFTHALYTKAHVDRVQNISDRCKVIRLPIRSTQLGVKEVQNRSQIQNPFVQPSASYGAIRYYVAYSKHAVEPLSVDLTFRITTMVAVFGARTTII